MYPLQGSFPLAPSPKDRAPVPVVEDPIQISGDPLNAPSGGQDQGGGDEQYQPQPPTQ